LIWITEVNMKIVSLAIAMLAFGVLAVSTAAQAQGQNGRYCVTSRQGATNCGFSTRAQCEQARRGTTSDTCVRNPQYRGR
jgi:hypothetical protein